MDNIVVLALVACALSALIGFCTGVSLVLYIAGRDLDRQSVIQVGGQTQVLPDYFDRAPRRVAYNPRPETIALRDEEGEYSKLFALELVEEL